MFRFRRPSRPHYDPAAVADALARKRGELLDQERSRAAASRVRTASAMARVAGSARP